MSYPSSYGTLLGSTFATLFPVQRNCLAHDHLLIMIQDKIQRMVLDGVVNPETWYDGKNLVTCNDCLTTLPSGTMKGWYLDADKALEYLYEACSDAGPDRCSLYAPTAEQIANNVTTLYDRLARRPIPVLDHARLWDLSYVRLEMLTVLYVPYIIGQVWTDILARLLAWDEGIIRSAEAGTSSQALLEMTNLTRRSYTPFLNPEEEDELLPFDHPEAMKAVICNDAATIPGTEEDTFKFLDAVKDTSSFWDFLFTLRTSCS
jgi:hypothetical protein